MNRELRDHLGELLAEAMLDPAKVPPVHWLHAYCRLVARKGQTLLPFHEVLRHAIETADAFLFDPVAEAGAALVALDLLELRRSGEVVRGRQISLALAHPGWDLDFPEDYRPDLGEVTIKVRAFWDALRRVYERAASPAAGLEQMLSRAATLFNAGLYFEFHEILEGHWMQQPRGPTRDFLQGLIQIAIGLYQVERRNPVGALAQFQKGLEKTEGFDDAYLGIELAQFLAAVRRCRDTIATLGEARISEFDPALIPKLRSAKGPEPA